MRLNNPLSTPIRSPLHGLFTDIQRFPDGAILHYDADIDPYAEQTGGPHSFEYSILSPQYQRNADGSYTDVGAKPAVDVFGGQKWVRSCGAVTNLLPSGADNFVTGWTKRGNAQLTTVGNEYLVSALKTFWSGGETSDLFIRLSIGSIAKYTPGVEIKRVSQSGIVRFSNPTNETLGRWDIDLALLGNDYEFIHENHTAVTVVNQFGSLGTGGLHFWYLAPDDEALPLSFYVRNPIITATSYPVPYTPPGTTQPASNATTTNGSWFTLPDGSPLWKALTGEPLTLATRVRMGVGSGDVPDSVFGNIIFSGTNTEQRWYLAGTAGRVMAATDGVANAFIAGDWPRNAVVRRVTQVNAAGTQFRVGYMIEGTHTEIQWSAWANYDGSFNPSTLYRLMLGYNNPYPMWFNKITAWKKQATDAEILEAMA